MQLPHWRFIQFQISRKLSDLEVMDACQARKLLVPNNAVIRALRKGLGEFPSSWQRSLTGAPASFVRWLRDNGLLYMWKGGPDVQMAYELLDRSALRRDIEGLMVLRGDQDSCLDMLGTKYREEYLPTRKALDYFLKTFWDFSRMDSDAAFSFLEQRGLDRPEYAMALQGDDGAVCGVLGIKNQVSELDLLNGVISLADQQIVLHRQMGSNKPLTGSAVMGLAALVKQAMEAMDKRKDLGLAQSGADAEMRRNALRFTMSRRRNEAPPSLEDLRAREEEERHEQPSNVIEAEFKRAH